MTAAPDAPNTATLTITCPDRQGIVAATSQCLHRHGANIIHSDQHSTDPEGGTFFMTATRSARARASRWSCVTSSTPASRR